MPVSGKVGETSCGLRLYGSSINFPMTLTMMHRAKPHHIHLFGVIVMMGVHEFHGPASLARLLRQKALANGTLYGSVSRVFLRVG